MRPPCHWHMRAGHLVYPGVVQPAPWAGSCVEAASPFLGLPTPGPSVVSAGAEGSPLRAAEPSSLSLVVPTPQSAEILEPWGCA